MERTGHNLMVLCSLFSWQLQVLWAFEILIRTGGSLLLIVSFRNQNRWFFDFNFFKKKKRTGTWGYWKNQILHNMLLTPWLLMSCGCLGEDYSVASNECVNGKWVLEGLVWTVQIDLVLAQNCVFCFCIVSFS